MIWFTADTHFEHEALIVNQGRQGFASIAEHDAAVIDSINRTAAKRDFLYILGDFSWSRPQYWRQKIQCKNCFFVIGNHDKPEASRKAFGTVHQIKIAKLGSGERAVCCHYPIAFWPSCHHGTFHFYGHAHAQKESLLDAMLPQRKSMDVGVDNAYRILGEYRPFSEDELQGILRERTGHDPVSQYRLDVREREAL